MPPYFGTVSRCGLQILVHRDTNVIHLTTCLLPIAISQLENHRQKETAKKHSDFKRVPILYFTQLLAIAMGCGEESLRLDLHYIDPKPLLRQKGLI